MKIPFSRRFLQAISDVHGLIEHNSPGTYYFQIKYRSTARMIILSGGIDTFTFMGTTSPGGSGCLWIGKVRLNPGIYKIVVGPVQTELFNYAQSESTLYDNNDNVLFAVLTRQVSENLEIVPGSVEQEYVANQSVGDAGGVSPYNGYGRGADKGVHNATAGYFSIEW